MDFAEAGYGFTTYEPDEVMFILMDFLFSFCNPLL